MNRRLSILKTVLWALVGALASLTLIRFTRGLGAVTHLSDATPWGLWIGLDVMSGVALAAGGFVLAATVYIFGLERYRPFVRPAILTAWLGYAAVAVGLIYDLGLPWRIWHPAVYWQHRSVLFEVAACVMLYLTVLTLEFAPVILEHRLFSGRRFRKILSGLERAKIPLVIAGIVLSTLHQSSLGSLFLIVPERVHPLWYSPIIYLLFFVSAVGLGLMMVVFESLTAAYFLGHSVPQRELGGLGKAASGVLWLYAVIRVADLAVRGQLSMAFDGSAPALLFWSELIVSAVLPATLLLLPRVRASRAGLGVAASATILGMVLYRLDVSVVTLARPTGWGYFPSLSEIATSLGILALFGLIFLFFAERLSVYAHADEAERQPPPVDPATVSSLAPLRFGAPARYSAAVIGGATVAWMLSPVVGPAPVRTPTFAARTVPAVVVTTSSGRHALRLAADASQPGARPMLLIDGNRNGNAVLFDHDEHVKRLHGRPCAACHHENVSLAEATPCFECHADMYESTSPFDHSTHAAALGGNAGCRQCHAAGAPKTADSTTPCGKCHRQQRGADTLLARADPRWERAPSYMYAMHELCIPCHERAAQRADEDHPKDLARCANCHDADRVRRIRDFEPKLASARRGTR